MLNYFLSLNFFKKPGQQTTYSSLHVLETSYLKQEHPTLPSPITPEYIKENGFLSSNTEKEKYLFHMAFHSGDNEKISNKSPLNQSTPGAVLINRNRQKIYKIYQPETAMEKLTRKEVSSTFGIRKTAKGVIGQGGFGKISICQNLISGQWHAVKVIKKTHSEQFSTAIGLNKLVQPNEIEFLKEQNLFIDCIETTDKFYIIQKLIEGENLIIYYPYSKQSNVDLIHHFFEITEGMLEAVMEFHKKGCLHRDISPDNFLYAPKERKVYLIDFGFALKLPKDSNGISEHALCGKDTYLAPELRDRRKNKSAVHYTYASDIYALGITIQVLVNRLPNRVRNSKCLIALEKIAGEMTDYRLALPAALRKIKEIHAMNLEEDSKPIEDTPSYPWQEPSPIAINWGGFFQRGNRDSSPVKGIEVKP
ncbi:protein kinase family protein [Legionella clemsonensis]|nr:protein kinase family protein [Legionella clemsonensis]